MSSKDSQCILIKYENCTNEIVWYKSRLYEICESELGINQSISQNNEQSRSHRRVKVPPIQNKGWICEKKN